VVMLCLQRPLPARTESRQGWTSVLVQTERCLQTAVRSKQLMNVPIMCASMHPVLCMSKELLGVGEKKGPWKIHSGWVSTTHSIGLVRCVHPHTPTPGYTRGHVGVCSFLWCVRCVLWSCERTALCCCADLVSCCVLIWSHVASCVAGGTPGAHVQPPNVRALCSLHSFF
jgi:hypothetical protein